METRTIIHIIIFVIFLIIYVSKALIDMDKIHLDDNPIFVEHTKFKRRFDWVVLLNFLFVFYVIYFLLYSLNQFIVG